MLSTCCTFTWILRVCAPLCSFTWATARSQLLLFVVLASVGFGVSLRAATSNLPSSPNPLSSRAVLHDGRKQTRPSSFHGHPTLSANKHVVQICRSSLSAAVHTVQVERRPPPFNGIERSLCRAVVIKTKSLPVSATTFPTALSLYIAHDGRKHKHNPKISANKHVVQICAPRYRLPPMALQTVQVSVEPHLSTAMHKAETALIMKDHSVVSWSHRLRRPVFATTFPTALSSYILQGRLQKNISAIQAVLKGRTVAIRKVSKHQLGLFFLLEAWYWVIHGRLTSKRKVHFPSSFINQSTLLLERSSAKLLVFACTRTLDRL